MGKAKTQKHGAAASSPYERPSKQGSAAINNVFKFNTKDYGQRKGTITITITSTPLWSVQRSPGMLTPPVTALQISSRTRASRSRS